MRKIIESTLVTLDGVIEDPAGWVGRYLDDGFQKGAFERLLESDGMLLGRRTYEMLARDWAGQPGDFADRINSVRKYVFSSTLHEAAWNNSTIMKGDVDVVDLVSKLKREAGTDLAIYGHGLLAQTLLQHGLLDEVRLSSFPSSWAAVGSSFGRAKTCGCD
ncbi:MAG TPA: dihydrofolate reductase family protein [bacterium]|nr:dihydrofolate reductase family protein [bacterium]